MPDVWVCGTTHCHTTRSNNDGATAGRGAAAAAAAGGGGSAGPAEKLLELQSRRARAHK